MIHQEEETQIQPAFLGQEQQEKQKQIHQPTSNST
jgi:hypothetical protein